jgi:hypothetical protein
MSRPWAAVALVFVLFAVFYATHPDMLLFQQDLGWHLASGDLIREKWSIPETDPWAFTTQGAHWYLLPWGWDVAASALFAVGGLPVLTGVQAAMAAGITAIVAADLVRRGVRVLVVLAVALLVGVAAATFALPDVPISVSPQTWTLFLAAALSAYGSFVQDTRRWWLLTAVPLVLWLWVNTHAGYPLGYSIVVAWLADAVLRRDRERAVRVGAALAAGAALLVVNPQGIGVLEGVRAAQGGGVAAYISECRPFDFGESVPASLFVVLLALGGGWRDRRASWADIAMSAVWTGYGLLLLRHLAIAMVLSAPLLAFGLEDLLTRVPGRQAIEDAEAAYGRALSSRTAGWLAVVAAVAVAVGAPAGLAWWMPDLGLYADKVPYEETDWIEAHYPDARLFNDWNHGGFLIWRTHGRRQVFIDGRAGAAYPAAFLEDYKRRYISLDDIGGLWRDWDIGIAMIAESRKPVVEAIDRIPGYHRVHEGHVAIVWARDDLGTPPTPE